MFIYIKFAYNLGVLIPQAFSHKLELAKPSVHSYLNSWAPDK